MNAGERVEHLLDLEENGHRETENGEGNPDRVIGIRLNDETHHCHTEQRNGAQDEAVGCASVIAVCKLVLVSDRNDVEHFDA
jgi:hypothetical protein